MATSNPARRFSGASQLGIVVLGAAFLQLNVLSNTISGRRLPIIADAAAEISVSPGYERYLRNKPIGGARLRRHIGDLSDLTFRFLDRSVEFRAKGLPRRILSGAHVRAKRLFEVGVADRHDRTVCGICAKDVEISIPESAFSRVEHVERFALIRSYGCYRSHQHGFGFVGRTACLLSESRWRERNDCSRRGADHEFADHSFLLSRASTRGGLPFQYRAHGLSNPKPTGAECRSNDRTNLIERVGSPPHAAQNRSASRRRRRA